MSRKLSSVERELRRLEKNKHSRELYHRNIEYQHQRGREKYQRFKEPMLAQSKRHKDMIKRFVLGYYSDGKYCCNCCSENTYQFLSIDHIINGGAAHRKVVKQFTNIYHWLRVNLFPDGYQVLCYNCNCAKEFNRGCPHQMGPPSKVI